MGSGREALTGGLHHVEVWVPDLAAAEHAWGWLLGELGWEIFHQWPAGRPQTYAGYLSDNQGYEVELVATR
ncbi:VOC family protein [Micromonospora musae]|uniref:VOC family protein n=1 Tax=Micromonospora musae TaxID=1894970 RepID=UPI0033DAF444